jgi:hypothetical protein
MKVLNKVKWYQQILLALVIIVLSVSSSIAGGNEAGHGGDGDEINKEVIRIILNDLKTNVRTVLSELKEDGISKEWYPKTHLFFSDKGAVAKDVLDSKYIIASKENGDGIHQCIDKDGQRKNATTPKGVKGADICFDLDKIWTDQLSEAQIVALAYHEHAHHFGFGQSAANQIAAYVQIFYPQFSVVVSNMRRMRNFRASLPEPLWRYLYSAKNCFLKSGQCRRATEPLFIQWETGSRRPVGYPVGGFYWYVMNGATANEMFESRSFQSFDRRATVSSYANAMAWRVWVSFDESEYICPFKDAPDRPFMEVMRDNFERGAIRMRDGWNDDEQE